MDAQDTKNFIKGKVLEYLNNVQLFFAKIQKDQSEMQEILNDAKLKKAEHGEEGFDKVKENLIRMQELHYNVFLLNQAVQQNQGLLYEYNVMAKLHGVEIVMDKETETFFNNVVSSNPHIFRTEKGQVLMNESEETNAAMKGLESKMRAEETLKKIYKDL